MKLQVLFFLKNNRFNLRMSPVFDLLGTLQISYWPALEAQLDACPTGYEEEKVWALSGLATFFCGNWSWNIFYIPFHWFKKDSYQFPQKNVHKHWYHKLITLLSMHKLCFDAK